MTSERSSRYRTAQFLISAHELHQLPPDEGREVAFAGRSNAGKSSGINALTDQKRLAKISKTPGRTQLINYFRVAPERHLVDLPGYGYAKVPDAMRRHWQRLLERYLSDRRSLTGIMVFMDARHPLTPLDRQLLDWCQNRRRGIAGHILLTKADKLKRGPAQQVLREVNHQLRQHYQSFSAQLFSAQTGAGVDTAHQRLDQMLFADIDAIDEGAEGTDGTHNGAQADS